MNRLYIPVLFCLLIFPLNLVAQTAPQPVDFTVTELRNIGGHYSTIYGYFFIKVKGKQVSTNYDGKYIQLIKKSDGHFYARYKLLWVFPISLGDMSFSMRRARNGKTQILMHQNRHTKVVAQKFISRPVPQSWKRRLGTYKATRIKGKTNIKKVRLALKNNALVAYINDLNSPYPLVTLSNTQLKSPSAGNNHDRQIRISLTKNSILLNYDRNKLELKR